MHRTLEEVVACTTLKEVTATLPLPAYTAMSLFHLFDCAPDCARMYAHARKSAPVIKQTEMKSPSLGPYSSP